MGRKHRPASGWEIPCLQAAVAFVWLATGLGVLHPYYREIGSSYLSRIGLPDGWMFVTCAGEVVLGVWVALGGRLTAVTAVQCALILGFTAILTVAEPALWAHPFGILSKNVPLLAVIGVIWLASRDGWSRGPCYLLRAGMASIWILEGLFSKLIFVPPQALDVVSQSGLVPGDPLAFLRVLGVVELASGAGVLLARGTALKVLLMAQAVALIAFPLLLTRQEPSLWFHPFGPLTKNVPILAGTVLLWHLTPRGSPTPLDRPA